MKSVFKTFSQSTLNVMTKACLTVLCVFVLSSVGSAQSFMEAQDAVQVLKPYVADLQVEWEEKNQNARVITLSTSTDIVDMRYQYFSALLSRFSGDNSEDVSRYINKNHYHVALKYNASENNVSVFEGFKQEAINLLSN